jgi:hypothetical protein
MARRCEICESLGSEIFPAPAQPGRIRRIVVGERLVSLCEAHAAVRWSSKARTLEELRLQFPEPMGSRSLLPRRAPLDRRQFPPRPEGRRQQPGRREGER